MQIQWLEHGDRMARQIAQVQNDGVEYAFVSEDWRQCMPLLHCKEFLLDAMWATIRRRKASLYGFRYDPSKQPPVCLSECRVLLRNIQDGEDFVGRAAQSAKCLAQIDRQMGWPETRFEVCDDPPPTPIWMGNRLQLEPRPIVAFISGAEWLHAPPLLSLYSLLVRVGMTYPTGDALEFLQQVVARRIRTVCRDDPRYLKKAGTTIRHIVNTSAACFAGDRRRNWPSMKEITLHEDMGIVSFSQGYAREYCPHWYEEA